MSYASWKAHMHAQYYYEGLEKKRQRNMPWFLETFLPSVAERIGKNPKFPNSCIVSQKQADVLWFYMEKVRDNEAEVIIENVRYSLEWRGDWPVLVRKIYK